VSAKGHIRQRPSGSWALVLPVRQRDGTTRQKWFTCRSKQEAEALRKRLVYEIDQGTYLDPAKDPFVEFLGDWIAHAESQRRSPRTVKIYRDAVTRHIAPYFGKVLLGRLTPRQFEEYYGHLLARGRVDGSGGLSVTTVRLQHGMLHAALKDAVRWEMIPKSPLDAVRPPPPGPRRGRALGLADTERLAAAAHGTRLEVPVLLAVFGGLRRGEVIALAWSDVDFDLGRITIRAAKTPAGVREVHLPPFVMDLLRREKGRQAAEQLARGPRKWKGTGTVAAQENGRPWTPSQLTTAFQRFAEGAGFGRLRFHDCRHTAGTSLIAAGIPTKIVSKRLGHANTVITENLYGHVLVEHDEAVAAWLEKRFGPDR